MDTPTCPYVCKHEQTEIRKRTQSNGVLVLVRQCLRCGDNCGGVAKAKAPCPISTMNAFDEALREGWQKKISKWYEDRRQSYLADRQAEDMAFWRKYNEYLLSDQWRELRRKVFARCKGICEGCGVNRAVQVHHLTYAHVFNEFLFELVGVCLSCHGRAHQKKEDANV